MKISVQTGKVRWWLVGVVAFSFLAGASFGSVLVYATPTFVRCSFTLPDSFQIPSAT